MTTPAQTGTAPASQQPNNVQSASLYVGDLKPEVTEALLFEIFNAVGPVASIRVCRNAVTRKSLGYAYVNFHNVIDAERALDTMNFTSIRGRPCRIMWSMRDPTLRKSGKGNIFVKNLDPSIDHKTLYDTFSMFGDILSCKVAMKDGDEGKQESLGYGFVHYGTEDAAKNAITKVNGMEIAGKTVIVETFKAREKRDDGPTKFTNVYIKNLPQGTTKEQLVAAVQGVVGDISPETSVFVKDEPHHYFKACWGCVDFADSDKAADAVKKINEAKISLGDDKEKVLEAFPFQSKRQRRAKNRRAIEQKRQERMQRYQGVNVYIKNLHDTIDDARLRQEFSQFGEITSARVMTDEHKRSKGFGFVCFAQPEQATKAITEMNTKIVEGKPLYVALHQPRAIRDAQLAQRFSAGGRHAGGFQQGRGGGFPGQNMGFSQGRNMYQQPQRGPFPGYGTGGFPSQNMGYNAMNTMGNPMMYSNPQGRGRGRGPSRNGYRGGPRGGYQQQNNQMMTPGGPAPASTIGGPAANSLHSSMGGGPLNATALSKADPQQQKQMIGERIYPLIQQREPKLAGKITGMLLEMDNTELLHLLENQMALNDKINEALSVLREHDSMR